MPSFSIRPFLVALGIVLAAPAVLEATPATQLSTSNQQNKLILSIELGHMITFATTVPDLDDDGVPEVAHGGTYGNGGVVSSATGETLFGLSYPSYAPSFDASGDVDGDGVKDLLVGGSTYDGGVAVAYSGWNFTQVFELLGADYDYEFASTVAAVSDVDGDGVDDVLVSNPFDGDGWVALWSSRKQGYLYTIATGGTSIGWHTDALADVNGDGRGDFAVLSADSIEGEEGAIFGLRVTVYDGLRGSVIWTRFIEGGTDSVFSVPFRRVGDLNGDGVEDLGLGFTYTSQLAVFSGDDGRTLFTVQGPADSKFGYNIAGGADVTGDGIDDLLVGAPNFGAPNEYDPAPGAVFLYAGTRAPVSKLRRVRAFRSLNHDFGRRVNFFDDLDGDGVAEVGIVSDDFIYAFSGAL